MKKDGLPEMARKIMKDLSLDFNCFYEVKDAIGKRYRRQDAIGTPICITIDHDSLEDESVTIRYRDSMKQKRVKVSELESIITQEVSMKELLKGLV
jgi:glycyl-tRNA synthetase